MFEKKREGNGVLKSVLLSYFILTFHVLLIAGMAVLVLLFRGVVNYTVWILLGGIALIGFSAFYLIRRMRAEGKSLREMLRNPMFEGRSVEVSLFGGMATLKLGRSQAAPLIGHDTSIDIPRIEDSDTMGNREVSELTELARLLEKDLITVDEFNQAKRQLLNG